MSEPDPDFDSDPGSDFDSVPDFVPNSAPVLLSGSAPVSAVDLPLIDLPMSYHLHNTIRYVCVATRTEIAATTSSTAIVPRSVL